MKRIKNMFVNKNATEKVKKFSIMAFTSIFVLAGCSAIPEQINTVKTVPLTPFESVVGQSDAAKGGLARWGGEIIEVVNLKEHTEIEMLQYPTNHYGKPVTSKESQGRFKAKVKGFIDPLVFKTGRLVTLVGEFDGPQEGIIGEQTYMYPVLAADGYHMWKETQDITVDHFHYSPFSLRWGTSFFPSHRWYSRSNRFRDTHRVKTRNGISSKSNAPNMSQPSNRQRSSNKQTTIRTDRTQKHTKNQHSK